MEMSRLRNALKKLRKIQFDHTQMTHVAMASQEMLDFLAMLEGIKPVYLLGRGFDDPDWIVGVYEVAVSTGLKVVKGRGWAAEEDMASAPAWYQELNEADEKGGAEYYYICKAPVVAAKLAKLTSQDFVSPDVEAALLGYPACCVAHYHSTKRTFDEMFFGKIERAAKGDIEEMKRIVLDDDQFTADTPAEEELFRSKLEMHVAPFTSFNMCPSCIYDPLSPAKRLSITYGLLAKNIDPNLADEIAFYQAPMIAKSPETIQKSIR